MTNPAARAIATLPLKEMEASLLRSGILARVDELGLDRARFAEAIDVASYVHRGQTRKQRGGMPIVHYIEHPLRNALRALRYGVSDPDILVAVILHDTVEDGAADMASVLAGRPAETEEEARATALEFVRDRFGEAVSEAVGGLSNPLLDDRLSRAAKNEAYVEHVAEAIRSTPVLVAKFVDFADNALSLHHSDATYARKQATKYLPLVALFEQRLGDPDVAELVGADAVARMREALDGNRLRELAERRP
jgi:(p)ppGpp synthase/HD superfamily hydrolase